MCLGLFHPPEQYIYVMQYLTASPKSDNALSLQKNGTLSGFREHLIFLQLRYGSTPAISRYG
jgi:hypothetical protein